jgi:hypothetical protein
MYKLLTSLGLVLLLVAGCQGSKEPPKTLTPEEESYQQLLQICESLDFEAELLFEQLLGETSIYNMKDSELKEHIKTLKDLIETYKIVPCDSKHHNLEFFLKQLNVERLRRRTLVMGLVAF